MEKKATRPSFSVVPLFFFLLLSFPRPSISDCAPRSSSVVFLTPPSSSAHPPSTNVLVINTPATSDDSATAALDPSIKAVCDRTTYPDLCFSSIKPLINANAALYIRDTSKVGITSYLELLVKSAKQQTKQTAGEFSKGAGDPSTDPTIAPILKGCVSKFGSASEEFDTVLEAIAAKDIPTAQTFLSGALTYYSDCTDGEAPGITGLPPSSPWVIRSQNLVNLVDNCLDLCAFIK